MSHSHINAFVESLREVGHSDLSLAALARAFGISLPEFIEMAGVQPNPGRTLAESDRTQQFARDLVDVIDALFEINGDLDQVLLLVRDCPIPALGNKTALAVVIEGRAECVLHFLHGLRRVS